VKDLEVDPPTIRLWKMPDLKNDGPNSIGWKMQDHEKMTD